MGGTLAPLALVSVGLQLRLDAFRGNRTPLALGLSYTTPGLSVRDRLSEITTPTLLVNGRREKGFQAVRDLAAGEIAGVEVVDLEGGHLLVSSIGNGCVLGVVASKEAKLGNIAYEMTLFANRAGAALSPQLIMELKNGVGA